MAKQKSSNRTISETFKTTYPSTRCIEDCTKDASKPSFLSSQSSLYWRYKQHFTYKGSSEIGPFEVISFISEFYGGYI